HRLSAMPRRHPVLRGAVGEAISAYRNSDDETRLFDRRKLARCGHYGAAIELALFDALEQHAYVVAGLGRVDRLAEDLAAVAARRERAADVHGAADPQHASSHPTGRDDATVTDHESALDCQSEHVRSVPALAADEALVAHQEVREESLMRDMRSGM